MRSLSDAQEGAGGYNLVLRPPLNKSRGFRLCWHSHHPAMEPRVRSLGLLSRRTPAWRTSALWVWTRPAFVRWYSRILLAPGSGRLDAREERSGMHLIGTLV